MVVQRETCDETEKTGREVEGCGGADVVKMDRERGACGQRLA